MATGIAAGGQTEAGTGATGGEALGTGAELGAAWRESGAVRLRRDSQTPRCPVWPRADL